MIKNVILAIILLVQLTLWFVLNPPWAKEPPKSEEVIEHTLEDIPFDEVARIEVTGPGGGEPLRLLERDKMWVIENVHGFPAVQDKVYDALNEMIGLSRTDFRTSKRFLHENFEVDEAKGQRVKLFSSDNQLLCDLIIGKRDLAGTKGTFIRPADQDHVFVHPSQKLATAFSTVPRNWYQPGMMDVPITESQKLTELRSSCNRLEIEFRKPVTNEEGVALEPPQYERVRYVYQRVDPEEGDAHWKVIEPEGKDDLELSDVLVKGMVGAIVNVQAADLIGTTMKPEYGLSDPDELEVRVVARFKEGEVETTRSLMLGATVGEPAPNQPPTAMKRYAKASHPGNPLRQSFVFTVQGTYPNYFKRPPESFVQKTPTPRTPPNQPPR